MKKQLTPAEQLAKAQVPKEEQPYQLPKGWQWVRLGGLTQIIGGGTPSSKNDAYYEGGTIPWIRPADLSGYQDKYIERGERSITELGLAKSSARLLPADTVLLSTRAPIGYVAIAANEVTTNQGFKSFLPSSLYEPSYLYWYLKGNKDMLERHASGTTFLELSAKRASEIMMPLPPMEEQQRIVQRIESLFAKLDAAEARLNAVAASFAPRKDALLHQAFTGELLHKQLQETMPMDDILADVRIGPFGSALHKQDYHEGGIPVINPKHIVALQIKPEAKVSISATKADELSAYKLQENDIIMGRRGEMGRCAPVGEYETGWLCGTGSMILRLKDGYDAKFYAQIISSQTCKQYLEMHAVGSTMKNLNERIVRGIPIPKFSPSEQRAIVAQLDHLLSREHQAAVAVTRARTELRRLRAAILARAFRGEL
jgi:type I restriction enzyme S subunit